MPPEVSDLSLEHAVRVWTHRHSGTWTEEDERQLRAWLAAAPENRAAHEKVARLWATAGRLERRAYDAIAPRRMFTARAVAVGCTVVLIAALAIPAWFYGDRWWNGVPVHWIAPRGESRTLMLEDGTHVLLDADSDLVVKLGAYARRVSLVRGEALFTVTHNASRPFEIEIGPGRVMDLGTRFDVEKLPSAVHIAVFEGRVGVRTVHGEVVLGAGRGGGYDDSGTLLPVSKVDAAATLRPDGQRHFDSEPLATIVARLARYHSVTFVFADPRLQELRVSGTFRVTDLPLFLTTLSAALPIEARWVAPQRVEFVRRNGTASQDLRGRADDE
jgi:transmembrane sensor